MKVYKDKTGLFYYKKKKVNGKIIKKKIRIRMKTKQKQTQRQSQKVVVNNIMGSYPRKKRKKKGQTGMSTNKQKDDEYLANMRAEVYRAQQKAEGKDSKALKDKINQYERAFSYINANMQNNNSNVKINKSFKSTPVPTPKSYPKSPPTYASTYVSPYATRANTPKNDVKTPKIEEDSDTDEEDDKPKEDTSVDSPEMADIKQTLKDNNIDIPKNNSVSVTEMFSLIKNKFRLGRELKDLGFKKPEESVPQAQVRLAKMLAKQMSKDDIKHFRQYYRNSDDFPALEKQFRELVRSFAGKGSGKGEGIDNISINRDMKKYRVPGFCGCYMSDELKYLPKNKKTFCFIYNTDTSKGKGIHWIAINVTKKSLEYYDPLAGRLRKGFLDSMSKVLRRNGIGQLKLKVNAVRDQRANSDSCGFFSSKFLIDRARGNSFSKASGYSSISKAEKAVGIFRKKFNKYV